MFCSPGSAWLGWHPGGWFMPGFMLLVFAGILYFCLFLRRPLSSGSTAPACPACSGNIQDSWFRCPHCGEVL